MFSEGIFPIGDGLLDVDEQLLKGLLVPHDINDIYDVEQTPFARGKFAAVRRAIHKNSGVHFAAKFLKRRRRAQSSDKEIKHEIAVLMLCDGAENIVKLNAVHESRSDTALLLELATGGELQTFLDNEECLTEAQARFCMREVLKGLQFLHKRSIAHLDLKPQNILLTGENIEDGLKLCDFGISRVVAEGSNVREIVGTPDYVAPEVLQYEPLSLLTDIWSVGVLTYVLLTGFSPFGGDTKQETFLNISQCALEFPDKLFDGVSSAAIDFMRCALRIKPNDRMSAAGCLEHIWLKDECDIGRQIYNNNISKVATNGNVDASCSSNSDLDEDDDDAEQHSDSQSDKMESSDVEVPQATKKTQTTTAVHTVPATRATTIPLCTHIHQKHYQQQQRQRGQTQQHMSALLAGRRHSSDANKENTFLATKKIQPITNVANGTMTNKSTATIIIGATTNTTEETKNGTNISQINNEDNNIMLENNIVNNCLFPDAPTTPKVIRKAPNSDDTSPTSVKALVKKFQLEPTASTSSSLSSSTTTTSTTTTTTTSTITNGTLATAIKTPPTVTTTNGKCSLILKQQQKQQQQQQQPVVTTKSRKSTISPQKILASPTTPPTTMSMKTILVNGNQSHRRSSEPQMSAKSTRTTVATAATTTSPTSYKSTCVYCLTCGATSNNVNGEEINNSTTTTTNGCRHSAVRTTTSPTSSGSKTSLIPLYHHRHHHHHHQHHHHHELVVAKNGASAGAASNLTLDQGIIC